MVETPPSGTYESALEGMKLVRQTVQAGWGQVDSAVETVNHIVTTGIAHTSGIGFQLHFYKAAVVSTVNMYVPIITGTSRLIIH